MGTDEDASAYAQAAGPLPASCALNRSRGREWLLATPLPLPVRDPDAHEALIWKGPLA